MRPASRCLPLFFLLFVVPFRAHGAIFELSNGDRISGELVAEDAESVTVKMALGGAEVKLPRSALKTPVVPAATPKPVPATAVAEREPTPPKPATEVVTVEKSERAQTESNPAANPKESRRIMLQRIPNRAYEEWEEFWEDNVFFRSLARVYPLMDWNNQVNIGLSLNSGNTDTSNLDLLFKTEKRSGKHQTRLEMRYEFDQITNSENETRTTRDWWRGNARYRFDYVKSFFIQSDTNYQRRLEKGIFHEADEMVGIGYRWLDTERMEGSVTPSLGFGYRDISDLDPAWGWLASFQQDLVITLNDRVRVTEESEFTYEPEDNTSAADGTGPYAFSFRAGLENQLNRRLSLILRYEFNHDERIPESRGQTTHGIRFNLGAKF